MGTNNSSFLLKSGSEKISRQQFSYF